MKSNGIRFVYSQLLLFIDVIQKLDRHVFGSIYLPFRDALEISLIKYVKIAIFSSPFSVTKLSFFFSISFQFFFILRFFNCLNWLVFLLCVFLPTGCSWDIYLFTSYCPHCSYVHPFPLDSHIDLDWFCFFDYSYFIQFMM